ncbi:MAG: DUF4019 domain-containing protein [Proteobacteria bacterium]|nr:DUF4019 domain-containing protein [Pseudomonadota bacterium]
MSAAAGLGACSSQKDLSAAEAAITQFHQELDGGQFESLYSSAAPELKQATTEAEFVKFLGAVHKKLGNTRSTARESWRVNWQTSGEFISLRYATEYEQGKAGEDFVFRMAEGAPVLVSYNVNSRALITN